MTSYGLGHRGKDAPLTGYRNCPNIIERDRYAGHGFVSDGPPGEWLGKEK